MSIVDNNVLSALAKIERLDLLPAVFDSIGTPTAVMDELDRADAAGYHFVSRIDTVTVYNGGWIEVIPPSQAELELATEIRDQALSTTDARCLAIASHRDRRLVTDDRHVGTIGRQRDVEIWDLPLFLRAAIQQNGITSREECSSIVEDLRHRDGYRFSTDDEAALFETFESS